MLASSAIEASRNWTSALTRIGFGTLVLTALSKVGLFPAWLSISSLQETELSLSALPVLVFWVMLSMVIGAIATMIGSIGHSSKFGENARAHRSCRVGMTGNQLLADLLRDANNKYELASGFVGVLYILLLAGLLALMLGIGHVSSTDAVTPTSSFNSWITAGFGAAGGLFSYLAKISATSSIMAIDQAVETYYPVKAPQS